jgi:hypothetical protein
MLSTHTLAHEGLETCNSLNRVCTHIISAVVLAKDLYFASVLDLKIVACFFAFHDTRLFPKKIANPPIDRLSSKEPAQSTSEYPVINVDDDLHILRPRFVQDLIYHNILLTAARCTVVGACKN